MRELKAHRLTFAYGGRTVLDDVSFTLTPGRLTALLGPNGAGKSTLIRCLLGLLSPLHGAVTLDGADLSAMTIRERARALSYIPQHSRPAFSYSALEMVLMGAAGELPIFAQPSKAQIASARQALDEVGALALQDRDFRTLSGGEAQLVLIARALAQRAEIILMDEPEAGLDYGNRLMLLRRLRALADSGRTVLFSTHEPQSALTVDEVLAVRNGSLIAHGAVKDVLDETLLRRLYSVEVRVTETAFGTTILPRMEESR